MPRRKKFAVWLSITALRDAVEAMTEYVTTLHDRARRGERSNTRQDADRMAASANEVHDALDNVQRTGKGKSDEPK
jgi:hypothetical protein